MREVRVSSSWTLFYKIFLPTVWIVFVGTFTVFSLMSSQINSLPYSLAIQGTMVMVLLLGLAFLWFTLMNLKRVEMAEDSFYVTNYFKTYRYGYKSIKRISDIELYVMRIGVIEFNSKSSFGNKIYFVERRKVWEDFIASHQEQLAHVE
jgi:hypothetical protein